MIVPGAYDGERGEGGTLSTLAQEGLLEADSLCDDDQEVSYLARLSTHHALLEMSFIDALADNFATCEEGLKVPNFTVAAAIYAKIRHEVEDIMRHWFGEIFPADILPGIRKLITESAKGAGRPIADFDNIERSRISAALASKEILDTVSTVAFACAETMGVDNPELLKSLDDLVSVQFSREPKRKRRPSA
ncbi:hypothetical protein HOE67_03640 [Candidatus Peregrinibacteria bacterium]|jgi:hypothetical protein|nr:hypothetical protein [Candidatus Peregrinibacteria bacterium]MBT4056178.1 hypothetical protein [Candidatus Peregrinibacteria bacterium]